MAALVHDPALAEEPDTIDLVASAAGLPLENTRLQADLRAEFQFLVTLVDTAPSLFVHLDLDGTILNQNLSAAEVAGVKEVLNRITVVRDTTRSARFFASSAIIASVMPSAK